MAHESKKYRKLIEDAGARYGLDPDLVEAIVRVESSGLTHAYRYEPGFYTRYLANDPHWAGENPRRVSASYGLMQIMYPTAWDRGFRDQPEYLFLPHLGLHWGCAHLGWLAHKIFSDEDAAIAAYNVGQGNVVKGIPPAGQIYLTKVRTALQQVKEGR